MSNSIFKAKNLRFVIIGFWLIIVLFPLSWIAITSIKPTEATLSTTPVFLFTPTLQNYMFGAEIMDPHTNEPIFAGIASQFPRYLGNSILIALMSTFIALAAGLTSSPGLV